MSCLFCSREVCFYYDAVAHLFGIFSVVCSLNYCNILSTQLFQFFVFPGDLGQSDENVEHLCWGLADNEEGSSVRDSILGRVIGGADDYTRHGDEVEDGQEPLALLVAHAAMHMLFLPQFTCEFFEDNNDADLDADFDDDSNDSSREDSLDRRSMRNRPSSSHSSISKKKKKDGQKEELTEEKKEAQRLAQLEEEETNLFMKTEAGLKETRYADSGVLLLPRPTTIIWAGGIGIKPSKVSAYTSYTYILVWKGKVQPNKH